MLACHLHPIHSPLVKFSRQQQQLHASNRENRTQPVAFFGVAVLEGTQQKTNKQNNLLNNEKKNMESLKRRRHDMEEEDNDDHVQQQQQCKRRRQICNHCQNICKSFLPKDLLYIIFSYLKKSELIRLGGTCRMWWRSSRAPALWRSMTDFSGFRIASLNQVNQFFQSIFQTHPYVASCIHSDATAIPQNVPVRHIHLPANCLALDQDPEWHTLRNLCPQIEEVVLPSIHIAGDANGTPSITDAVLRELGEMSNLKKLVINTHEKVTDQGIRYLSEGCAELNHIALEYCKNVTPSGLLALFKGCGTFRHKVKSINALNCASCALSTENLLELARFSTQMEDLSVEFHSDVELDAFDTFTKVAQNIRNLTIRGWQKMSGYALSRLFENLRKLEKLNLLCHPLTQLVTPMIKSNSLKEFCLVKCEFLRSPLFSCPNLARLHFENIQQLSDMKIDAPSLMQLNFKSCKVDAVNAEILFTPLKSLKMLDIFDCSGFPNIKLHSKTLDYLSLFMCPEVEHLSLQCEKLKTLKIDQCAELKTANVVCPELEKSEWFPLPTPNAPNLHTLQLDSERLVSLSVQKCINLKTVALKCKSLSALNMADCKVLEAFSMECPSLEKLALAAPKVPFSPSYAHALALNSPKVFMLSLSNIPSLTDECMLQMCQDWPMLQALIVASCDNLQNPRVIGDKLFGVQFTDCVNLVEPRVECQSLCKLTIKNAPRLNDNFLNGLAQTVPKLKTIELTTCATVASPQFVLPELTNVLIKDCAAMQGVLFTSELLKQLHILECVSLSQIALTCTAKFLQEIVLQRCLIGDAALQLLLSLTPCLVNLVLQACNALVSPQVESNSLRSLQLAECPQLTSPKFVVPSLTGCAIKYCPNLKNVSEAIIKYHPMLVAKAKQMVAQQYANHPNPIQIIQSMINQHTVPLEVLDIVTCGIETLALQMPLDRLAISGCTALRSIEVASSRLSKLAVLGCQSLQSVTAYGAQTEVSIRQCLSLAQLMLQNAKALHISQCPSFRDSSLQSVLHADQAQTLQSLFIETCPLQQVQLSHSSIQNLCMIGCTAMQFCDLKLQKLQQLDIIGCSHLNLDSICNMDTKANISLRDVPLMEHQLSHLLQRSSSSQQIQIANTLIHPERLAQMLEIHYGQQMVQ